MTSKTIDTLLRERQAGFPDLVGSRLSARIPLRERVLNAIVGRFVARQSTVETVELVLLPANRLHVTATMRVLGFRKSVRLPLHIQPMIDATTGWEGGVAFAERSLMSTLLSTAAPFVRALPPGITVTDSGVVVQLPQLLDRFGAGDLMPHLKGVMFETEAGTLWISATIEVREHAGPAPPAQSVTATQGHGGQPGLTLDEIQASFHGATADVHVRVAAPLVNALVAAGLDDAAAAIPEEAPRPNTFARVRSWIEHHLVSFEEGAMVVDAAGTVPEDGG